MQAQNNDPIYAIPLSELTNASYISSVNVCFTSLSIGLFLASSDRMNYLDEIRFRPHEKAPKPLNCYSVPLFEAVNYRPSTSKEVIRCWEKNAPEAFQYLPTVDHKLIIEEGVQLDVTGNAPVVQSSVQDALKHSFHKALRRATGYP